MPVASVALAAVMTVLVSPVAALADASAVRQPADPVDALLVGADQASRVVAYEGVQLVSSWGSRGTESMVAEVRHWPGQGSIVRIPGTALRPGKDLVRREADGSLDVAHVGQLALLSRHYETALEGRGRVAGRTASLVAARRDDGSLAARFWLDTATGLLLRREVYDRHGSLVRAGAFLELVTGGDVRPVPGPLTAAPRRDSQHVGAERLAELRDDGWVCPDKLPHGLARYDARELSESGATVLYLSFSDGLSTVSLFEQQGHLKEPEEHATRERIGDATVYVQNGLPLRLTWSAEGTVYTVLADAPDETVHAVVAALPHGSDDDNGVLSRLRRGLGRFVSWLNPFG